MSPSAQGLAQHLNTLGSLLLFSDQCQGDFHGLWLSFLSLLSPWEGVILLSRELGHSAAGRRERGVREETGLGQLEPLCKESALGFPQIADLLVTAGGHMDLAQVSHLGKGYRCPLNQVADCEFTAGGRMERA